jgi:hypothetical protein
MDKFTSSDDVQRGEAGQFAALFWSKSRGNGYTMLDSGSLFLLPACTLRGVPTTLLLPLAFSSLTQAYAFTRGEEST